MVTSRPGHSGFQDHSQGSQFSGCQAGYPSLCWVVGPTQAWRCQAHTKAGNSWLPQAADSVCTEEGCVQQGGKYMEMRLKQHLEQAWQHLWLNSPVNKQHLDKVQTFSSSSAKGTSPAQLLFCSAAAVSKGKWATRPLGMCRDSSASSTAQGC